MRVALVCPYSLTSAGGVQRQVLGLLPALRRAGCDTVLIGPADGLLDTVGVCCVGATRPVSVNGSVAPMTLHPGAVRATLATLRRGRFDVIHLHEPFAPSITLPVVVARPAPLVATFHAAGDRTPYRWFGVPLRRLASRIDARVAVSHDARRLAQRHLRGDYEVLYNAVDVLEERGRPVTRSRSVLFLGRHEPRKGLDVLLTALAWLPSDVEVWIAGRGPQTERLVAEFGHDPRLTWLGEVSESERTRLLRSAGVLCVPSLGGESFGVVLLEALAAGAPVVASDLDAYRRVVRNGAEALLVPPGNARELVRSLTRVLDEPQLARELAQRARERSHHFDIDALAKRYLAIYERVCGGRAHG